MCTGGIQTREGIDLIQGLVTCCLSLAVFKIVQEHGRICCNLCYAKPEMAYLPLSKALEALRCTTHFHCYASQERFHFCLRRSTLDFCLGGQRSKQRELFCPVMQVVEKDHARVLEHVATDPFALTNNSSQRPNRVACDAPTAN